MSRSGEPGMTRFTPGRSPRAVRWRLGTFAKTTGMLKVSASRQHERGLRCKGRHQWAPRELTKCPFGAAGGALQLVRFKRAV
jgi:hypothetical protein